MNDVVKELTNYTYQNTKINKWVSIFKRTKNKRIQNKQFAKILIASSKERKIIECSDVVLLDISVYNEMHEKITYYEELKKALEKQIHT